MLDGSKLDHFAFSPLHRDVLDILWKALQTAARTEDKNAWERNTVALEQYIARQVRIYALRNEWNGNAPKG